MVILWGAAVLEGFGRVRYKGYHFTWPTVNREVRWPSLKLGSRVFITTGLSGMLFVHEKKSGISWARTQNLWAPSVPSAPTARIHCHWMVIFIMIVNEAAASEWVNWPRKYDCLALGSLLVDSTAIAGQNVWTGWKKTAGALRLRIPNK